MEKSDFDPHVLADVIDNGFSGLDGIFRFRPDGLVQRGLAVLQVQRGGNTIIDPPPQTFQNLGF